MPGRLENKGPCQFEINPGVICGHDGEDHDPGDVDDDEHVCCDPYCFACDTVVPEHHYQPFTLEQLADLTLKQPPLSEEEWIRSAVNFIVNPPPELMDAQELERFKRNYF